MINKKALHSQRSKLPGVFNITNGHLCKSEPFDAANFALTCGAGKTSFRGNIGVTLHTPKIPDQYRNINIVLPPLKPKVTVHNLFKFLYIP